MNKKICIIAGGLIAISIIYFVLYAYPCIKENRGRYMPRWYDPCYATETQGWYDGGKNGLIVDDNCINSCKQKLNEGQNLSVGPCLSNEIAPDWVCDVAHDPRQPVDILPENQCNAYREGKAKHFVEVDEYCNLIRAV